MCSYEQKNYDPFSSSIKSLKGSVCGRQQSLSFGKCVFNYIQCVEAFIRFNGYHFVMHTNVRKIVIISLFLSHSCGSVFVDSKLFGALAKWSIDKVLKLTKRKYSNPKHTTNSSVVRRC